MLDYVSGPPCWRRGRRDALGSRDVQLRPARGSVQRHRARVATRQLRQPKQRVQFGAASPHMQHRPAAARHGLRGPPLREAGEGRQAQQGRTYPAPTSMRVHSDAAKCGVVSQAEAATIGFLTSRVARGATGNIRLLVKCVCRGVAATPVFTVRLPMHCNRARWVPAVNDAPLHTRMYA